MKQKMLFNLPIPIPCGALDFSVKLGIVALACSEQQALLEEMLARNVNRKVWMKIRSRGFWSTCRRNWTDADYVANIRVDKATFLFLVERLAPYLLRENTRLRNCIEVDERVAIALEICKW